MKKTLAQITGVVLICLGGIRAIVSIGDSVHAEHPQPSATADQEKTADQGNAKPQQLGWIEDNDDSQYGHSLELGHDLNRMVLVDFCPPWCGPCQQLKRTLFDKPATIDKLGSQFVLLRSTSREQTTAKAFGVKSWPRIAIVTVDGQTRGFQPDVKHPELFWDQLNSTVNKLKKGN